MLTLYQQVHHLQNNTDLNFILSAVWIINYGYYMNTSSSLILGQYAQNREKAQYHSDLMVAILKRVSNHEGVYAHNDDFKFLVVDRKFIRDEEELDEMQHKNLTNEEVLYKSGGKKDRAIFFLDTLQDFDELLAHLLDPRQLYQHHGHFCIILTGKHTNLVLKMQHMFEQLFNNFIINVNVLVQMKHNVINVYTYFPYKIYKCRSTRPFVHAQFTNLTTGQHIALNVEFFPSKLNMYGCDMAITKWFHPPFVMDERDPNRVGTNKYFHGIEGNIMHLLGERLNFKIKLVPPVEGRGTVTNAGQATGMFKMLAEHRTNISLSGFIYDPWRATFFAATYSYLNTPIVFAIPRGRPLGPYERLIKPFELILWCCFITSVLLGICSICAIKMLASAPISNFVFGTHNRLPLTNLWSTLYGAPIQGRLPMRNFARYLLAIWLLYTLIVRTIYSGQLYFILQDGRAKHSFQLLDELVKSNYTFYASATLDLLLRQSLDNNITSKHLAKEDIAGLLQQLRSDEARYTLVLYDYTLRYENQKLPREEQRVNILSEVFASVPITFYLTPHSYFTQKINNLLLSFMSAGLIRREVSFYLRISDRPIRSNQQPDPLTVSALLGIFNIFGILLVLCLLVFCLEIRSRRSARLRRFLNFFNM